MNTIARSYIRLEMRPKLLTETWRNFIYHYPQNDVLYKGRGRGLTMLVLEYVMTNNEQEVGSACWASLDCCPQGVLVRESVRLEL